MKKVLWMAGALVVICVGMLLSVIPSAERRVSAEIPPEATPVACAEIEDVCSLRPPRRAALVAMNLKSYIELRNLLATNDNRAGLMLGDGKIAGLLYGAEVRILKVGKGHAEALVIRDNQEPGRGPGGRPLGMTGAELVGRKVWLDITQWAKID